MSSAVGMASFSNFIRDMGLLDILVRGRQFIWSNNQVDLRLCKLDRFLFSQEWLIEAI